jgi:hypothetical protein
MGRKLSLLILIYVHGWEIPVLIRSLPTCKIVFTYNINLVWYIMYSYSPPWHWKLFLQNYLTPILKYVLAENKLSYIWSALLVSRLYLRTVWLSLYQVKYDLKKESQQSRFVFAILYIKNIGFPLGTKQEDLLYDKYYRYYSYRDLLHVVGQTVLISFY